MYNKNTAVRIRTPAAVKIETRKLNDDFLVAIDKEIAENELFDLSVDIGIELNKLRIYNDVIIRSESKFNKFKDNVAYVDYYVIREGGIFL